MEALRKALDKSEVDLYKIFCEMDKDKDGNLDYEEFSLIFYNLFNLEEKDLQVLFKFFDADRSGKISWQEFFDQLFD